MSDLGRFIEAQADRCAAALAELRAGAKRTHWIWFILPQLRGLGTSPRRRRVLPGTPITARAGTSNCRF